MIVRFTTAVITSNGAFGPGQVVELADDIAEDYIHAGFCERVGPKRRETAMRSTTSKKRVTKAATDRGE